MALKDNIPGKSGQLVGETCKEKQTVHKSSRNIVSNKDNAYSWLICFTACLSTFLTTGFTHAIGVYFVVFRDTFETNSATASWVSSLNYGGVCFTGWCYYMYVTVPSNFAVGRRFKDEGHC